MKVEKRNLLTIQDLLKFCQENQMYKFSSQEHGYKLSVQVPSTFNVEDNIDETFVSSMGSIMYMAIDGVLAAKMYVKYAINKDFEQANANLAAILGKQNNEIGLLTETALSLGRATEWTASQVTQLQTELAKLGFGEGSIIAMQKHVLAFATAVSIGASPSDKLSRPPPI